MAGGQNADDATTSEDEEATEVPETSGVDDFLIVGDGILLAYRGSEEEPELPAEVKSVAPGVLDGIHMAVGLTIP